MKQIVALTPIVRPDGDELLKLLQHREKHTQLNAKENPTNAHVAMGGHPIESSLFTQNCSQLNEQHPSRLEVKPNTHGVDNVRCMIYHSHHAIVPATCSLLLNRPSDRRGSDKLMTEPQYAFDMYRFLKPCNSPYFTQLAAFFIAMRAK